MLAARPMGASLFFCGFFLVACGSDAGSGDDELGGGAGAGVDAGSGGSDDDDDDDTECVSEVVEMPADAVCAAATRTCIDGCEDDEDDTCYDNCLAADPDPEGCEICIDDAYVACGNQMGCQPEWDAMICCLDGCADPESEECWTSCAVEGGAYETCLESFDETCFAATAVCFQP